MDPITSFSWGTFQILVNEMLTIDAARSGTGTFVTEMIRQACLEIQSFVPCYRQWHETLYYSCDFALDGHASKGTKPPGAQIIQMFHISMKQGPHCIRRIMESHPWQDRFELVHGSLVLNTPGSADFYAGGLNSWNPPGSPGFWNEGYYPARYSLTMDGKIAQNNRPKYCIDPEGYNFWVYPQVTGSRLVSMWWNGPKMNFQAAEYVPFDEPMALAVAEYVKAKISREINHDVESHDSYMKSYMLTRTRLYIDWKERKQ